MTSFFGVFFGTNSMQTYGGQTAKAPDFNAWFSGAMDDLLSRDAGTRSPPRPLEHQDIDHHDLRTKLREQLSEWADMSVGERLRQQYLDAHDLSDEALEAMPADERAKVEKEIAAYVEDGLKRMSGTDDAGAAPDSLRPGA
ncbi:hypothetical protein [Rhizobium halophytocola]|uniref:Uncharacterized protein n=1 Tax=Rhizobium halophytocola TaxID=735519 RepID=A0ABS4E2N3_9HYPH|nr:hypothetical protein [Rhizobium halophytocola]MBP1852190.1 hypothetical protein [Rhizobium halophytocola]